MLLEFLPKWIEEPEAYWSSSIGDILDRPFSAKDATAYFPLAPSEYSETHLPLIRAWHEGTVSEILGTPVSRDPVLRLQTSSGYRPDHGHWPDAAARIFASPQSRDTIRRLL